MSITRVKICGITRPEDAVVAAEHGVDYLGLNFLKGPRKIDFALAAAILDFPFPAIQAVGLFWFGDLVTAQMEAKQDSKHCLHQIPIHQTYGIAHELLSFGFAKPPGPVSSWPNTWFVANIHSRESIGELRTTIDQMKLNFGAILFDAAPPETLGGSGRTFNWNWIAEAREAGELEGLPPIILAGGLNPENVAEAIRIARPYAVDVSSGVEVAGKPGVKDPIKMRDFIQAAKSAL